MKLIKLLKESKASEMAHKLGLIYLGYGYWADKSAPKVPVAKTMNGYLVKLEKKDHEFLAHNDPSSDPTGEANKDDDWFDPDVKNISTHQYFTGVKNKSQAPSYSSGGGLFGGGGYYGGGSYGGFYGGSGSGSWVDAPPKQPKLPEDLPTEKVMSFKSDSSGSGTMNDAPMSGAKYTINDLPLTSWEGAPEKPKKKWKEEGAKEDVLKWKGVAGTNPNLKEPETTGSYHKAAAGVVIMEPDGRIWVVEPTGHFGGYQHSIPKGTADKELTLQECAIKEAYEESGLQVEIIDYIGDVDRTSSSARYYLAKRVGGTPLDHGWESFAVKLIPTEHLDSYVNDEYDENLIDYIQKNKNELIGKVTGNTPPNNNPTKNDLSSEASQIQKVRDLAYTQTSPTFGGDISKIAFTQYGNQKGSNDGGFYIGADGVKRYVKYYSNDEPEKAMGEVLANSVYKGTYLPAPVSQYIDNKKGGYAFASNIVPRVRGTLGTLKSKHNGIPQEVAHKILDGFAADILTMNWDVVGLELDNIVMADDGSKYGMPIRIDNGGSFLSRAMAGKKETSYGEDILYNPTEFQGFFKNPQYRQVLDAAGIKKPEDLGRKRWERQVKDIVSLHNKHKGWEGFVDKHTPDLDPEDKRKIVKMLYTRTSALIDFVRKLPPDPEPEKKDTSKPETVVA